MLKNSTRRMITLLAGLSLLFTTLASGVNAAMVGTETAVNNEQRAEQISEVRSWMRQDQVRSQLVAMGVDPENATERVASMTSEELQVLHGEIEDLPAGAGLVEVIGLVFIVLLILELVGVTDIFAHM